MEENKRLKLLMITMRPLIPYLSGYSIRMFYFLKGLKKSGFDITLISFCPEGYEFAKDPEYGLICDKFVPIVYNVKKYYLNCLKALFNLNPFKAEYFNSKEAAKIIDNEIRQNNFDYLCGFYYHSELFLKKYKGKKWIDLSDSIAMQHNKRQKKIKNIVQKLFLEIEKRKVLHIEKECLKNNDLVTLISKTDEEYLSRFISADKIKIIRMGTAFPEEISKEYNPNEISFMGDMSYFQNVDACEYFIKEILPELSRQNPDVIFKIIGNHPAESLRKLAQGNKNIRITGFVEDVNKELITSLALVCPIRISSGQQTKVLQSLALGVPVISTEAVIKPVTDREDIIIKAETIDEWINAICQLKQNPDYRRELSLKSRKFIEENYSWDKYTDMLKDCLINV